MNDSALSLISIALSASLMAATATYLTPTIERAQAETKALERVGQAQHLALASHLYQLENGAPAPSLQALAGLYLDAEANTGGLLKTDSILADWFLSADGYYTHPATDAECAALKQADALNTELQCSDGTVRIRYTQ